MARLKHIWWPVLLLAVVLLLVELFLREFFPLHFAGDIRAYQYDPDLGVRLKRDVHYLETTDYQVETLTNRMGTTNFQSSFAEYRHSVITLGDSYTQGTGLPVDASYPFQLDFLLNTRRAGVYEPEYAVVNLGAAGYGGMQNLKLLRMFHAELNDPGFILYLGSDNDYVDDQLFDGGYRHQHLVDSNEKWGGLASSIRWVTHGTEIGKRLKYIAGRFGRARYQTGDNQEKSATSVFPSVAELEQNVLDQLYLFAQENDSKLVVSWSHPPGDPSGSFEWLRQWAQAKGVRFADWHAKVDSVLAVIPELPLYNPHSAGHYRAWVNQMIAQAYAEQIFSPQP